MLPDWLIFFQRTFPSANMVLVNSKKPVLIDTGFGSDFPATLKLLQDVGVSAEKLSLIINTHYHSDHVGGNHGFQTRYQIPVATYYSEARLVNQRDINACSAIWLAQPIQPYHIDRSLHKGDQIDAGEVTLEVIHTPGHTLGHMSLYAPQDQVLILGDVVHADDVSWVNIFREGVDALQRTMETIEKLMTYKAKVAVSGHGGIHHDPQSAMERALRRYEKWLQSPEKIAWHAVKRIFSYAMMLKNGIHESDMSAFLLSCPWFHDYSCTYFGTEPTDFVQPLLDEMVRSGAAEWQNGRMIPCTPYNAPPLDWYPQSVPPRNWAKHNPE